MTSVIYYYLFQLSYNTTCVVLYGAVHPYVYRYKDRVDAPHYGTSPVVQGTNN